MADPNYTCYSSVLVMNGSVAERKSTDLNTDHLDIAVASMGTEKLTITKDLTKWTAKEKIYDAKPFEEKELIAEGLVTVSDGEVKLKYKAYDVENGSKIDLEDAVDAGTYILYACFDGDKKYAPYIPDEQDDPDGRGIGVMLGTFKITPREITLTADLNESYTAGTIVSSVLSDVRKRYQVTNPAPGQEDAFAGMSYFKVTEAGSKTALSSSYKLQREKNYEVRYNDSYSLGWWEDEDVWVDLDRNYTVKDAPVAKFGTVPGNSTITSVAWSSSYSGPIFSVITQTQNDESDPMKLEVTMTEAIKWSEYTLPSSYQSKNLEGNLIAFKVTAPAEYSTMPATAMYQNEIEANGGYIVSKGSNYFTAVFDATDGKDRVIKLRWEDGYVETYTLKFSEAVKLENLNNAVAPKALAFNAPNKKMAVGQEQQLDVKITKEQMGDVIYLGYESDDTSTLVVDQYGNVTALKLGSATITVFPQKLVNGKTERIKNAKSATLKIQVTKLEAPKKVKATVHDTYIGLDYDSPAYGYRREIYVVKKSGSFKTAQNFETALKGMKENQWKAKGFAIAPIYLDEDTEKENKENYNFTGLAEGLDVKTDYTIYVRNVCAVRTLTDGTGGVVTQAAMNDSASGVVVNAKTKKTEIYDLALMVSSDGGWDYIYGEHRILWLSKLKNGVAQIEPYGLFPAIAADPAADPGDMIRIKLPFTGEDKAKYKDIYEEPKLEYVLRNCFDKKTGTWGLGTKNDYAGIDKKGKIKFTGIPREDDRLVVEVLANGSEMSGGRADFYFLDEADSVKAAKRSVTLSVGQKQNLGDLLAYNLGKMKLTAYPDRYIDVEKVRSAIKSQNQEKNFTVNDSGVLTAINGGGTLTLDLTDKNVEKISGTDKATAKVTIKSKDLEPVKSLKARDVIHNNFGLTFKYTGHARQFLLEISDAKKPIYSKVIGWSDIDTLYATDKNGKYIQVRDVKGNLKYDYYGDPIWTEVKDTYEISNIKGLGITFYKESQYTVSLTPIYDANKAKPAVTKVKTTKIPATDSYLNNYYDGYEWIWGCDRRGGMSIIVSEGDKGNRKLNLSSSRTTLYAVSGDTYTLTADVKYNRGRVNDTLIWTVGNSKVASVKTAAGTYCITLKGVKPGDTTLEVKSKITGKVIARYDINVSAVQDAYRGNGRDDHRYYGENEPD